jgi:hypothetical protein
VILLDTSVLSAALQRMRAILLRGYPVITASLGDHALAADITNQCRRKGVTASTLCSVDRHSKDIVRATSLKLLES